MILKKFKSGTEDEIQKYIDLKRKKFDGFIVPVNLVSESFFQNFQKRKKVWIIPSFNSCKENFPLIEKLQPKFAEVNILLQKKFIKDLIKGAAGNNIPTIIIPFYEDSRKTPSCIYLNSMIRRLVYTKAKMIRISCKANNYYDNIKIVKILKKFHECYTLTKIIAHCTGKHGIISERFYKELGSEGVVKYS